MEILSRRYNLILFFLLKGDGWITSSQLAQRLEVSERTIRSSIAEITLLLEEQGVTLVAERGKGYRISDADKPKVRAMISFAGTIGDQRQKDLMMELIELAQPTDADEISERLFISRSTLENELKQIKKELKESNSDISLVRKKNTLWLEGSERSKRVLIVYHMNNRYHNPMTDDLISYSSYFPYEDLTYTADILRNILRSKEIVLSDSGMVSAAVHILIAVERISQGFTLETPYLSEREKADCSMELTAAKEIWDIVGPHFGVTASAYECESLAYCIFFRRFFRMGKNCWETLEQDIHPKYLKVIRETLYEIKDTYFLDLTQDDDLYVSLAYHLQSTVEKSGYCQNYVNPILEDIRSKYPFVFDLAIFFRNRFLQELGVAFNESETAYLAVHLGASVERLKTGQGPQKLKAVLVSHGSPSTSTFLMVKILSMFGSRLYLCGPYSVFDSESVCDEKPDLIISTTTAAMEWSGNIPLTCINLIPTEKDTSRLHKVIEKVIKNQFGFDFSDYFFPDLFFPMLEVKNSEEAINCLVDELCKQGIAQPGFRESTFQREQFSTTVLQNGIAMPHPNGFYANKTAIAVATLAHPVEWGGSRAQIVFMLAVKNGDQKFLQSFYELMVTLSDSLELIQEVRQIKDFSELLVCFNSLNKTDSKQKE